MYQSNQGSYHGNTETALILSDGSINRKILFVVQKYCTNKNCFQKTKPGKQVNDFYNVTNELLQNEVKKDQPSSEKVFTVLTNMLLLLNNAAANSLERLSVIRYDTTVAMDQLEKACHINKRKGIVQAAERREAIRKEMAKDRSKRAILFLKRIIAILLILLLLIFLSGFFLPKAPVPIEVSKPFYTEAYDWVRFNIFGDKEPEIVIPFSDQYRPYTYLAGILFLVLCCFFVIIWFGQKVIYRSKSIYCNRIKRDWNDFQLLETAFTVAEQQLAKMEE